KVRVTGRKEESKIYYRHSGYAGGLKEVTLAEQRERHPDRIIMMAVKGMMPKTPLGRSMMKKLRVYEGADHPHRAQQPAALEIAE
ncbi:MAG: 50S ribosomal protein L13, partial [Mariprofundales bacterium]|nr:50S ribosomal protein L13 [Mariprofundales bacterium]